MRKKNVTFTKTLTHERQQLKFHVYWHQQNIYLWRFANNTVFYGKDNIDKKYTKVEKTTFTIHKNSSNTSSKLNQ